MDFLPFLETFAGKGPLLTRTAAPRLLPLGEEAVPRPSLWETQRLSPAESAAREAAWEETPLPPRPSRIQYPPEAGSGPSRNATGELPTLPSNSTMRLPYQDLLPPERPSYPTPPRGTAFEEQQRQWLREASQRRTSSPRSQSTDFTGMGNARGDEDIPVYAPPRLPGLPGLDESALNPSESGLINPVNMAYVMKNQLTRINKEHDALVAKAFRIPDEKQRDQILMQAKAQWQAEYDRVKYALKVRGASDYDIQRALSLAGVKNANDWLTGMPGVDAALEQKRAPLPPPSPYEIAPEVGSLPGAGVSPASRRSERATLASALYPDMEAPDFFNGLPPALS